MDRTGVIVSVNKDYSQIKLLRHTACGSCGACHLGDDQKDVLLFAKNKLDAEVGDMVEVSMGTDGVLSAAFIMYMIPLIAFFIGLAAGMMILNAASYQGNVEIAASGIGVLLMAGAFGMIKVNENRFLKNDKYTAHVEAIIQKGSETIIPL